MALPTPILAANWSNRTQRLLELFFGLTPLFLVTVQSWSNAIVILGAALSVVFLMGQEFEAKEVSPESPFIQKLVVIALVLPFVAIAVSSALRSSHAWADYDAPSRFLLSVAIFMFAIRKKINIATYLQYSAPASLIVTLLHQLCFQQPLLWGPGRMSTYFSDPLVFGYTSLTLGLVSLASINATGKDSKLLLAFKLIGAMVGFYLSVESGSRTGWFAVPIVCVLWIFRFMSTKSSLVHPWGAAVAVVLVAGLLLSSTKINDRMVLAFQEVAGYSWTGVASENSVGSRITFLRIAFDMFASQPLAGFGDTRENLPSLPRHIASYASPNDLRMALTSGFHNEIVTNAIRSGALGLVAATLLFGIPLLVFGRQLQSVVAAQRNNAFVGLVFTTC